MWGRFNPLKDWSKHNKYYRFQTEEELLASLTSSQRAYYLLKRDVREAAWYAGKMYQHSLKMTLKTLRVEERKERKRLALRKKRYYNTSIAQIEIPAEMSALFDIVMKG